MIASFILSRTLVPTMAAWLLRGQVEAHGQGTAGHDRRQCGLLRPLPATASSAASRSFASGYRALLNGRRARSQALHPGLSRRSRSRRWACWPSLGRDFFPSIKSGEIDMHMRAPIGTRLEEAAKIAVLVERQIRKLLPGQVTNVIDNCGLPVSGINQAYSATGTIGPQDCDITISLEESSLAGRRLPARSCARELPKLFPGTAFSFLPGDITAKILNFGLPAPIDVQISGRGTSAEHGLRAARWSHACAAFPGIADVSIQQT